ncbi:hypothetical protein EMIHUDRAFT_221956 [Emiliania huxleyi CCMP1516]|uniref:non-specific serine/threonine protein kinase n=2 Tax=Emiliania huxleyi TaxID=2903 RepID=A0A0D3HXP9_EMIH1|nr:hypothetical protein EMIHUDRAFT_221956 [Emiliania huxleyi CCMP1516]EOD03784.1 hypothetical protein EMIHUDRAFT_221956 [Emiliania huxleyi CCMP1516]|eukprot:XP_005756213.1 hypothetical protein EMIHUDRAFT_221956 [Emiliania huxleyi CCMP1516]
MEVYALERKLGQGSMGSVHLARRRSDGHLVALKAVAVCSVKEREQAANEVQILRSLRHGNIVRLLDSFVHLDEVVLAMQYCPDGDLAELIALQRKRLAPQTIRAFTCQLASALAHVHSLHIVHRDIKASNVFLAPDARAGACGRGAAADGTMVLLGDFGVAKALESTRAMACTQCGTPYYLPPEVCNGSTYNTRADMWSLGVLLFELCALRYPFAADTLPALVMKILGGKYRQLPSSTPSGLSPPPPPPEAKSTTPVPPDDRGEEESHSKRRECGLQSGWWLQ